MRNRGNIKTLDIKKSGGDAGKNIFDTNKVDPMLVLGVCYSS